MLIKFLKFLVAGGCLLGELEENGESGLIIRNQLQRISSANGSQIMLICGGIWQRVCVHGKTRANTSANQDAIKIPHQEFRSNDLLRSLAKVC